MDGLYFKTVQENQISWAEFITILLKCNGIIVCQYAKDELPLGFFYYYLHYFGCKHQLQHFGVIHNNGPQAPVTNLLSAFTARMAKHDLGCFKSIGMDLKMNV